MVLLETTKATCKGFHVQSACATECSFPFNCSSYANSCYLYLGSRRVVQQQSPGHGHAAHDAVLYLPKAHQEGDGEGQQVQLCWPCARISGTAEEKKRQMNKQTNKSS